MSKTLARVLLAMTLLMATPLIYLLLFLMLERRWSDESALLMSDAAVCGLLLLGWPVLWRRRVGWTPARRAKTVLLAVCAALAAALGAVFVTEASRSEETGLLFAGIFWVLAWLVGTTLIWQDTPAEAVARRRSRKEIKCPGCNYNMRGLHEARCPECGAQYTLDELLACALPESFRWGTTGD